MTTSMGKMKYNRSIFLCIFQEGYLRELLKVNRYSMVSIRAIAAGIDQFIKVSYCPKKYIDMVIDQFIELHDMGDEDNDERNAIIDELILRKYAPVKDEYYREQIIYYAKQIANDIMYDEMLNEKFRQQSNRIFGAYITAIGRISHDEDLDNTMKKNYINGLIQDLIEACEDDDKCFESLVPHIEKLVSQVEGTENIDGFTHYNSYLKLRSLNGTISAVNFEKALEVLLCDTNVELDILNTHTNPNYITCCQDNMKELCDMEGYYRCLNSLITEDNRILDDKQFIKTVKAVIQLGKKDTAAKCLGNNIELIKGR